MKKHPPIKYIIYSFGHMYIKSKKLARLNNKVYKQDIKDHRDYTVMLESDLDVPKHFDMRRHCPHVKSDLNIRSSLTHPILTAIETMINVEFTELVPNKKRKKFKNINRYIKDNNHDFSSEYSLYNNITTTTKRKDISFRHVLKTLHHNSFEMHTTGMVSQEKSYKIEEYARIANSGNHNGNNKSKSVKKKIINDMKYVLAQNIPIIGGIRLPFKSHTSKDGIVEDNVKLDFDYGVMFVGYTDTMHGSNDGYFIFQNSWGKRWGDKGYGYISYKSMMKQKCLDLWVITKFECENKDLSEHKLLEIDLGLNINTHMAINKDDDADKVMTENLNLIDTESTTESLVSNISEYDYILKCTCVTECAYDCTNYDTDKYP